MIAGVDHRFKFIDNLRGIAILLVVFRHSYDNSWGISQPLKSLAQFSQIGVQLFFIVSAYTLCLSLDNRIKEQNGWKHFFIRRFFRIAPLFYFGIIFYFLYQTFFVNFLLDQPLEPGNRYTLPKILANFLLVHDFYPGALNLVPGGWSIGTETTFYLLFPILFIFYNRFRDHKSFLYSLPLVVLGLSICATYLLEYLARDIFDYHNLVYFNRRNGFLYFNIICQLPVFTLGMSLYFLLLKERNESTIFKLLFALLLSFFIAFNVFRYVPKFISIIPFSAGLFFVVVFLLFRNYSFLNSKLLARIGQLSFSIYLFHFVFVWNGIWFLSRLLPDFDGHLLFAINFILGCSLTFLVALFSEKFIEKPGIRLGNYLITLMEKRKHQRSARPELLIDTATESASAMKS